MRYRSPCTSALAVDASEEEEAVEEARATTGLRWRGEGDSKDEDIVASDLVLGATIDLCEDVVVVLAEAALVRGAISFEDDDGDDDEHVAIVAVVIFAANIAAEKRKEQKKKREREKEKICFLLGIDFFFLLEQHSRKKEREEEIETPPPPPPPPPFSSLTFPWPTPSRKST